MDWTPVHPAGLPPRALQIFNWFERLIGSRQFLDIERYQTSELYRFTVSLLDEVAPFHPIFLFNLAHPLICDVLALADLAFFYVKQPGDTDDTFRRFEGIYSQYKKNAQINVVDNLGFLPSLLLLNHQYMGSMNLFKYAMKGLTRGVAGKQRQFIVLEVGAILKGVNSFHMENLADLLFDFNKTALDFLKICATIPITPIFGVNVQLADRPPDDQPGDDDDQPPEGPGDD